MAISRAAVRIVCIGNRFVPGDDLGPRVHDLLAGAALPDDCWLLDGGLQGLNLLGALDGARRVVFVDALAGVVPGRAVRVPRRTALGNASQRFDHAAGLGYLLRAMAVGCDRAPEAWSVVGASGPAEPDVVAAVAELALAEARRPVRGRSQAAGGSRHG